LAEGKKFGCYTTHFDSNYVLHPEFAVPELPHSIESDGDCRIWVDALPSLKQHMDFFFAKHPKPEREFQQLVAWENNRSGNANSTEYFITDIEYADGKQGALLDMLGLKWLSHDRKYGSRCTPVLLEMKYGIDSYDGGSGIVKHISDLREIVDNEATMSELKRDIVGQFTRLYDLDLVRFNKSASVEKIELVAKPEVILLLANHNPRSRKLLNTLEKIGDVSGINLRFFVASFAGYGMHDSCMMDLVQFRKLVSGYLEQIQKP
ncbi:MAG: hypothetical protein WD005_00060, partial [Haliea sp.]